MDGTDWRRVEAALEDVAGTLPDGIVEGAGIDGWRKLLDLVRGREWPSELLIDGVSRPLPAAAEALFPKDSFATLKVWIAPTIQINVFPYRVDDICFDFDTREIADGGLSVVGKFSQELGRTLHKPVTLSYEGHATGVFLEYDPATDTFASPQ